MHTKVNVSNKMASDWKYKVGVSSKMAHVVQIREFY